MARKKKKAAAVKPRKKVVRKKPPSKKKPRAVAKGPRRVGAKAARVVRALPRPKSWKSYVETDKGERAYSKFSTELYQSNPRANSVVENVRRVRRLGKRRPDGFVQPRGVKARDFAKKKSRVVVLQCVFRSSDETVMSVPVKFKSARLLTPAEWSEKLKKIGAKTINGTAQGGVVPGLNQATGKFWVLDSITGISLGARDAVSKSRHRASGARRNKSRKKR